MLTKVEIPHNIQHVVEQGAVVGFLIEVTMPYARSIKLSALKELHVWVNNRFFDTFSLTFCIKNQQYSSATWLTAHEECWEKEEKAKIFVPLCGGLAKGRYCISLMMHLQSDYLPYPIRQRFQKVVVL